MLISTLVLERSIYYLKIYYSFEWLWFFTWYLNFKFVRIDCSKSMEYTWKKNRKDKQQINLDTHLYHSRFENSFCCVLIKTRVHTRLSCEPILQLKLIKRGLSAFVGNTKCLKCLCPRSIITRKLVLLLNHWKNYCQLLYFWLFRMTCRTLCLCTGLFFTRITWIMFVSHYSIIFLEAFFLIS